jgi:hypothetical protein
MRVSTESLNRHVWFDAANSLEDSAHRAAGDTCPYRVVTSDHEQINRLGVIHGLLKPRLLHHVGCLDNLGDVAVASEVKENTKSHDSEPCLYQHLATLRYIQITLFGGEVTVTRSDVLELASSWVDDLYIAGEILVSVDLGEVAEGLVGDLGNIELVVSNGQQVVVDIFEDNIRDVAIGRCCITQSCTVVQVLSYVSGIAIFLNHVRGPDRPQGNMRNTNPCVYKKQVDSETPSFLLHVLSEANVVTPVRTIILLLDMTFKPSMGVGSMHKIDLTPFERRLGCCGRVLRVRLHPSNVSGQDDIVFQRSVAAVMAFAGQYRRYYGDESAKGKRPHCQDRVNGSARQ